MQIEASWVRRDDGEAYVRVNVWEGGKSVTVMVGKPGGPADFITTSLGERIEGSTVKVLRDSQGNVVNRTVSEITFGDDGCQRKPEHQWAAGEYVELKKVLERVSAARDYIMSTLPVGIVNVMTRESIGLALTRLAGAIVEDSESLKSGKEEGE